MLKYHSLLYSLELEDLQTMAELLERLKDKSILFLEDNIEFAYNTIVLFDVFVRKVYHAKTVSEAETLLAHETIDIIISDIKLKKGKI